LSFFSFHPVCGLPFYCLRKQSFVKWCVFVSGHGFSRSKKLPAKPFQNQQGGASGLRHG